MLSERPRDLLGFYQVQNGWMLVDAAVVHDDYGLGCWKWLHVVQEAADESVEQA